MWLRPALLLGLVGPRFLPEGLPFGQGAREAPAEARGAASFPGQDVYSLPHTPGPHFPARHTPHAAAGSLLTHFTAVWNDAERFYFQSKGLGSGIIHF